MDPIKALFGELREFGNSLPDDPKARSRARILQAAARLFVQHGYRKASVDEIARQAGLAKGTIYLYFKSKAEILLHAVVEEKRDAAARAEPILTGIEDPTERLETYLELAFSMVAEMPLLSRLMSGDREILIAFEDLGGDVTKQILEQQRTFLHALLMSVPGADPQTVGEDVAAVLGIIYATAQIMEGPGRGSIPRNQYARMLARLIVEGVNR